MSRRPERRQSDRRAMAALAALAAAASLSACAEVEPTEKEHYSPSSIAPINGEEGLLAVTLTQEGADRIEVATEQVARRAGHKVVPYDAVLYEKDGSAFVFTNPRGLTYVRDAVEIDRIAGDVALLHKGPAAGTRVVTVGAQQVHGAELEYGEY